MRCSGCPVTSWRSSRRATRGCWLLPSLLIRNRSDEVDEVARNVVPVAVEHDPSLAVRGQRRKRIAEGVGRETHHIRTIRVHQVDLGEVQLRNARGVVPGAHERDLLNGRAGDGAHANLARVLSGARVDVVARGAVRCRGVRAGTRRGVARARDVALVAGRADDGIGSRADARLAAVRLRAGVCIAADGAIGQVTPLAYTTVAHIHRRAGVAVVARAAMVNGRVLTGPRALVALVLVQTLPSSQSACVEHAPAGSGGTNRITSPVAGKVPRLEM